MKEGDAHWLTTAAQLIRCQISPACVCECLSLCAETSSDFHATCEVSGSDDGGDGGDGGTTIFSH